LAAEPHRERLTSVPQPPPQHEPAPPRHEPRRPGRHISLAYLDDDYGENLPQPSKLKDIDYLDAQLGLKAPGSEEAPPPKPPAWRLARRHVETVEEAEAPGELFAEPAPASHEPSLARTPAEPIPAVPWAIAFSIIALASALLAHVLAPIAINGFSTSELDFMVRLRAVEWLLAGNLVAQVGLLLKR
jgi:hypothetical protein